MTSDKWYLVESGYVMILYLQCIYIYYIKTSISNLGQKNIFLTYYLQTGIASKDDAIRKASERTPLFLGMKWIHDTRKNHLEDEPPLRIPVVS